MKIHIRHILVQQSYEAEDVLRLLKQGKDFAALAERFSICPSAKQGGDLGLHSRSGNLDEDFADAAFLLKVGEVSTKPVRTRFGYHIIQRLA